VSIQHGFQRLVLLGSAGYQRAELPLDDSVSLVAPNNAGKTSLINALQFLLIINQKRMDFGAHEWDKTRRFYFPDNSAYILLEVSLPESGTLVLGCVGKGVGHEYEYFVYAGSLDVEDFRLEDGSLVAQPQLSEHMAARKRLVHTYSSSDFTDLLYGRRRSGRGHAPDFRVFRLENAQDAEVYQKVLTRTLRLDRLTSGEVKNYLLQIFKRDQPDAGINFKNEWENAFKDVNLARAYYQAALNQQQTIDELEQRQEERLSLRGKVVAQRPGIDEVLQHWENHYQTRHQALTRQQSELEQTLGELQNHHGELRVQREKLSGQIEALAQQGRRQAELEQHFALINARGELEQRWEEARRARDEQLTLVNNLNGRELATIDRDIADNHRQQKDIQRELATLHDNLYQALAAVLEPAQLERLNRALSEQVMTLPSQRFELDKQSLREWLEQGDERLDLPGLILELNELEGVFSQRSEQELRQRLTELEQQAQRLADQREAGQAMARTKQDLESREKALKAIERDLEVWDEMARLQAGASEREQALTEARQAQERTEKELSGFQQRFQGLNREIAETAEAVRELERQYEQIDRLRHQRPDQREPLLSLAEQSHHSWLAESAVTLESLAEVFERYQQDCRRILELDRLIHQTLVELRSGGLTKHQNCGSEEEEVGRIVDFRHQLSKEAESLERMARSAVVTVTSSLRDLHGGLLSFEKRISEFNRLIGRRQLSDLETFRISPKRQLGLVWAIEKLVDTAETVSSGESFEIFSQGSVLDDQDLDWARRILVEEGDARSGLRVGDLFQLQFVVGKKGAEPESFDDIDSAASNGTVLMAKLVTGLAMLYQMQDQRHGVRAVCYLDEALALDADNQRSLIDAASEFGFSLIFASPAPLTTARYCVPIQERDGFNHISRRSWQILESLEEAAE
jgi:soluble cytochrome b562